MSAEKTSKSDQNRFAHRSTIALSTCVMGYMGWKLYRQHSYYQTCKKEFEEFESLRVNTSQQGLFTIVMPDGSLKFVPYKDDVEFKPIITEGRTKQEILQEIDDINREALTSMNADIIAEMDVGRNERSKAAALAYLKEKKEKANKSKS